MADTFLIKFALTQVIVVFLAATGFLASVAVVPLVDAAAVCENFTRAVGVENVKFRATSEIHPLRSWTNSVATFDVAPSAATTETVA